MALLFACGGKIPKTNYYMLDLPAPKVNPAETLPYTAVIMPLSAPRMLSQDRIVYRETREQVGFYEYHRWAEDPRDVIQSALLEQLRARGTFSRVVPFDGRTRVDYIIRGSLDRLEEVDFNGVTVQTKISARLIEAETNRVVWTGDAENSGEVTAGEVRSVVGRMSEAVQSSIQQLAAQIDAYVRQNASRPAEASAQLPATEQK
jgi:ABC-type uncharacterized transport system auxiliary subunit